MPANEANHGTTAAPDNTTLGADVLSVVPDSSNAVSHGSEKKEVRLRVYRFKPE